jgi:uncharacterized membrane protein YbhN (UPF0104 family)
MATTSPGPGPTSRWPRVVSWAASLVVLGVAVWMLHRYLGQIAWRDVLAAWKRLPPHRIVFAFGATAVSFGMLAMFDVLAARVVTGTCVPMALAAFAGLVTQGISNVLGFHAITGTALRFRIYATASVSAADVAAIVALVGLGVGMGFVVVITGALCWQPAITHGWGRLPGVLLLVMLLALLWWLGRRPRTLRAWRWSLAFPGADIAATQMVVGAVEMTAAIGALYMLLPAAIAPPFVDFLPIYIGAVVAGIVSHSPGGLGVFETIMLAAFPAEARADLLVAMVCYRAIYSLIPFALAGVALALFEILRRRRRAQFDGG